MLEDLEAILAFLLCCFSFDECCRKDKENECGEYREID